MLQTGWIGIVTECTPRTHTRLKGTEAASMSECVSKKMPTGVIGPARGATRLPSSTLSQTIAPSDLAHNGCRSINVEIH